jgi:hypothetical protein
VVETPGRGILEVTGRFWAGAFLKLLKKNITEGPRFRF